MSFDHLLSAANNIIPKITQGDYIRITKDIDIVLNDSWDKPRSRVYIVARMAEFERSLKVSDIKVKLLEALLKENK